MLKPTAEVQLIWQDETGSTAMTSISAPVALTVDEIAANAEALAAVIASLTDCALVKLNIKYRSVTVPKPDPATSTPITRSGAFYFTADDPAPDGIVIVPSIKTEVIRTDEPFAGVGIDRSNSDVIAFAAAVIAMGATNPFSDALTALEAAYVASRV